jgi:hypothetical protein
MSNSSPLFQALEGHYANNGQSPLEFSFLLQPDKNVSNKLADNGN